MEGCEQPRGSEEMWGLWVGGAPESETETHTIQLKGEGLGFGEAALQHWSDRMCQYPGAAQHKDRIHRQFGGGALPRVAETPRSAQLRWDRLESGPGHPGRVSQALSSSA